MQNARTQTVYRPILMIMLALKDTRRMVTFKVQTTKIIDGKTFSKSDSFHGKFQQVEQTTGSAVIHHL